MEGVFNFEKNKTTFHIYMYLLIVLEQNIIFTLNQILKDYFVS